MPRKAVKAVFVTRFGSELSSGERDDPQLKQTESSAPARRDRGGKEQGRRSGKNRSVLKVKLPKFGKRPLSKTARDEDKDDRTPLTWILDPIVTKTKTTVCQTAETQCAGPGSDSVGGDVFLFSQSNNSKTTSEKDKAKLAVLRSISRMLEENKLIRQRLVSLSQANCSSMQ